MKTVGISRANSVLEVCLSHSRILDVKIIIVIQIKWDRVQSFGLSPVWHSLTADDISMVRMPPTAPSPCLISFAGMISPSATSAFAREFAP